MRKVYIVNKSGHDFSAAEKYSKFVFVTEGTVEVYQINSMYRIVKNILVNSSADDLILLMGLSVLQALVCSEFVHKHKCLNLLLYKNNIYIERKIVYDN